MEVPTKQEHEDLKAAFESLLKRIAVLEARLPVEKIEVAEAATMLNKCESIIRTMAKDGRLQMIRSGHKIYVTLKSVIEYDQKHLIN